MHYQQLTQEQRYQIYAFKQAGYTQTEIAIEIGVHKSTVSREIRRNCGQRGYRPKQAQAIAEQRREEAPRAIKMTTELRATVVKKLNERWSPEQISGWLAKENDSSVSHERIYQLVREDKQDGGSIYKLLRQGQRKRRKKYGRKASTRGQIKDRVSIDERPKVVDKKERFGDWEGDTIIGKKGKGAIVTLVERKSKLTLIRKVPDKSAASVCYAVIEMLSPFKENLHTITFDNGKEFAGHKQMSQELGAEIYFAHPYSSWERGLNENTNGLIRQYIPKKTDFNKVTQVMVEQIEAALNSRPRKSLNFSSPEEILRDVA
jgi:IS30 family transposase